MRQALPVLLTLSLLAFSLGCSKKEQAQPNSGRDTTASASADSLVIDLTGQDSVTVFDLLARSHQVESRSTALGKFVVGIDSVANSSLASWLYSVNDTMPQVAADKLVTRTGDRVTWHFRRQKAGEPAAR